MIRCSARIATVIVAGILVEACAGDGNPSGGPDLPAVSVPLLSEAIPPCTPLDGVDHDPCSPQLSPSIDPGGGTGTNPHFVKNPPSFADIMSGAGTADYTPHVVVRGTVETGTTRCEGYPTRDFAYLGGMTSEITNYWCFADVRVNEYIVGAGPPTLTVGLSRDTFLPAGDLDWEQDKEWAIEHWFNNPSARAAATYAGRELVLFLKPTITMAVESWAVGGHWDTWFVRRNTDTDPPTVTASFRWENQVVTEVNLDDLVTEVIAAAAARTATGRTDTTPADGPPYLVTRADQLKDFYVAGGAVYEGENATTVLPPPAPVPPGVPTNIRKSVEDERIFIVWDPPTRGGQVDEYRLWLKPVVADGTTDSFYDIPTLDGERFLEVTGMVRYLGDSFTVQIRVGNNHGYSPWSTEQTFTSSATTPPSTTSATGAA